MTDREFQRAAELLAPFRRDFAEAHSEEQTAALRARTVPALRMALRRAVDRRGRAAHRRGVAVPAAIVAAAAAVVVVVIRVPWTTPAPAAALEVFVESGQVVHRTASGEESVEPGRPVRISSDGALATLGEGQARLAADGVEIGLQARTEVGLEELGQGAMERVRLHSGAVRCVVPPLGSNGRFSVVTPDATVVVHGTVFTVEVSSDRRAVPRTCVTVEDGVVSVRHRSGIERLGAGQSWGCTRGHAAPAPGSALPSRMHTADSDAAAPARTEAIGEGGDAESGASPAPGGAAALVESEGRASPGTPAATVVVASRSVAPGRAGHSRPAPGAELAEQNRLFQGALAAQRLGDVASARASLRELLQKYPDSPLASEARTMLERLKDR